MKVVWISNVVFPGVAELIGLKNPVVGGWMYSGAKSLISCGDIDLYVFSFANIRAVEKFIVNGINHVLIPKSMMEDSVLRELRGILPDIVHVHGTEYLHSFISIKAAKTLSIPSVVSIQGLVSVCDRYYYGGINFFEMVFNTTLRDIVRRDTFLHQKINFKNRAKYEVAAIKLVSNVIGRTDWDKFHVSNINNNIRYFDCNETLRDNFYGVNWNYEGCEKNSIFLSQAHYPIKGLHLFLDALSLIKKKIPDVSVYIAGNDFVNKKYKNYYAKIVEKKIRKYNLWNNINFCGVLDESGMVSNYLRANVFVCPSVIENSSNSISEAQILGVPCVASMVGGVTNMINHMSDGLIYRLDDPVVMAEYIIKIFRDPSFARNLSSNSVAMAKIRHCAPKNSENLLDIYKNCIS